MRITNFIAGASETFELGRKLCSRDGTNRTYQPPTLLPAFLYTGFVQLRFPRAIAVSQF